MMLLSLEDSDKVFVASMLRQHIEPICYMLAKYLKHLLCTWT